MAKDIEFEAKKRAHEKLIREHIENHRIYYFGKYDPFLDAQFPDLKLKGPNPPQKLILDAWLNPIYKIFTFTGGNRMGKTFLLTIIGICVMAGKWLWSGEPIHFPHKRPRKVRYVGQDWEEHIKTVVEPALNMLWPADRPVDKKKNNQGINATWKDKLTGSELVIMSNKQDSGTHEGWEGDLVLYDEPPKRDIRIANARGLVDREGREFFSMTLLKEAWIHREVIKAVLPNGEPDMTIFNVTGRIYDNIGYGITEKGVDQFAKTLKEDEKQARLEGKPSYLSGLIFGKLDRHTHMKERFKVPLDWIVDIAIDWHPSKAWHILFIATDTLNRKWSVFEICEKNNYKYIAEEIVRIIKTHHLRVESPILMDPLAKSGSQSDIIEETVYDKIESELIKYGLYLETASKDQNAGIDIINNLLVTETGEPAWFIFKDLTKTCQQMEDWMWDDGKPATVDEDMCENSYRIALRNTQYFEPRRRKTTSDAVNWRVV